MKSSLVVPVFTQRDDQIACLNKAMAFLTTIASSRFPQPTINLELTLIQETMPPIKKARLLCNKFKEGKDKVMLVLEITVMLLVLGKIMQEGRERLLNVILIKTKDLDAYGSDCDDVSNAKAVLMANLSNYGSNVISESMENVDLKGQIQEKVFVRTTLQNELRKLKGKNMLDNTTTITNAITFALRMFKLNLDPLAPRLLKNRDAHIDYLKYTQEQADILQG
uniref:Uncharacterized protein n=1 Tax=Tanacetum cinerariifolium TaxID=118510 RepID=A0A6L2K9N8_TANCI|nr:hypothetical protein [Tanacetum cinerariifolium]